MIEKASIYTMNTLNKSSELWHTSVNRKARPVIEGEHEKSWNDHGYAYTFATVYKSWSDSASTYKQRIVQWPVF